MGSQSSSLQTLKPIAAANKDDRGDDEGTGDLREAAEVATDCVTAVVLPIRNGISAIRARSAESSRQLELRQRQLGMTAAFILACTRGDLRGAQDIVAEWDLIFDVGHWHTQTCYRADPVQKRPSNTWTPLAALQGACQNDHMDVIEWLMDAELRVISYSSGAYRTYLFVLRTQGKDLVSLFADGHLYTDPVLQFLQKASGNTTREILLALGTPSCKCGNNSNRRAAYLRNHLTGLAWHTLVDWLKDKHGLTLGWSLFGDPVYVNCSTGDRVFFTWEAFADLKNSSIPETNTA